MSSPSSLLVPSLALATAKYPKSARLRRRAEFLRVQSEGARVHTPHFVFLLSVSKNGPDSIARIGIVVSKKVGGAVVRNRIKRVCREAFRHNRGFIPAGTDVVVIAKSGAGELGLAEVTTEWSRAANSLAKKAAQALAR